MLYQGSYFVVSVKRNFCQRQTHCIDDPDQFQSETDPDNEFTECQTPRKKLQSIGISPVSLQAFMKTLKRNISEAYKVQVDCLKDLESDSYDRNNIKENVYDLVRLQKAMREKLKTASYSEKIQILTLVRDNWSRMCCSEYFNVFEYLFELCIKSKKQVEYQQNLPLKKGKIISTETLHLVTNVYEDGNFSIQVSA